MLSVLRECILETQKEQGCSTENCNQDNQENTPQNSCIITITLVQSDSANIPDAVAFLDSSRAWVPCISIAMTMCQHAEQITSSKTVNMHDSWLVLPPSGCYCTFSATCLPKRSWRVQSCQTIVFAHDFGTERQDKWQLRQIVCKHIQYGFPASEQNSRGVLKADVSIPPLTSVLSTQKLKICRSWCRQNKTYQKHRSQWHPSFQCWIYKS